jgi:hypothetical protein
MVNGLIEAYERCGEVSFPLKIEIAEGRGRHENGDSGGEEERS